ncbi:MAG: hypothetical protein VR65_19395 [Desulfobulbaceae bacterium BRH_c16a]|nr:MAG: hypothetical protein VR65_19395 [Desulfobulbaceae bacterium BRH_c16a]
MTSAQRQDLFVEWDLYELRQQRAILAEYLLKKPGNNSKSDFLEFLADKLEIRGYWAKVGLA